MKKLLALIILMVICISFGCLTSDSGNDKDTNSDTTYTITGTVKDNSGNGLAGATVSLAGDNVNMEVSTDSEGRFSFQNIDNGTYTVISSKSGYAYSPESTQKSINNAKVSDVKFTVTKVEQISHGSLSDHEGPNAAITSDIILDVNQHIFSTFFSVRKRALESIEKIAADQPIRVDGEHSGYALFETAMSGSESETIKDDTCDFYDFSDDSALYIGGRIRSTSTTDSENEYESETIQGDISVAGTYKGSINCNVQKTSAEDGTVIGAYTAMSGGQSLSGTVTEEEFDTWEYTDGEGYTISGRIVDFSGNSIANIELSLTSAENRFTAITDDQGNYTFVNIPDATYGLLPISGGYTYTPEYRNVTVSGADVTADIFTASSGGSEGDFSISGRFLDESGNAVPDVVVVLDYGDMSTFADKEGNYYFGNLGNGDYTVTPALLGYTFSPPVRTVTVSGENVRADFTVMISGEGHAVHGMIVDQSGNGIAGIELSLTSMTERFTATTGDQGNYTFVNIPDAAYGLLPISDRYIFTPVYQNIVVSSADMTVETFIATPLGGDGEYSITGRVVDDDGKGLADVTVKLVLQELSVMTDKEGNYYFGKLEDGIYMVAPVSDEFTFTPEAQMVNVDGADARAGDFTVAPEGGENKHSIYGIVADAQGNLLADVTVILSGTNRTTQSDKEGNYFFGNVDDGAYTVIPSLTGYTFMPQYRTVTVAGSDVFVEPFLGTAEGGGTGDGEYTVSGVVTDSGGAGIEGVTMTLGGEEDDLTILTGSEGKFEFKNVPDGEYVVFPMLIGMAFTPPAQPITVRGSDVTANFTQSFGVGDDDTTFTITGIILDADGNGIADVSLSLNGATGTRQAITSSAGVYVIGNIKSETYILLPVKEGYTFSPKFMQVTPTAVDMEINFTGYPEGTGGDSFSVSGRIVTESGKGIPDIAVELKSVALDGTVIGIAFTGEDGRYYFEDIFTGEFTVTPNREGYSFDPPALTISISAGNASVEDFIGTGGDGDGEVYESYASTLISTGGGSLSVSNHRGDVITLEFPPLSLLESEVITLTTLTEKPGNPIADNIFPGVSIEPDGLILNAPAKLSVTLAEPPAKIDQCTIFWSIYDDYIIPIGSQEYLYDTIEGEIYHFSVYSAGKATQEEVSSQITKIATIGIPFEKAAAHASSNYGWQGTYTTIHGLLHWAEISMMHGHDSAAEKASEEAKKVAEEDAETFVDEVIPPVDPCKDKDYRHTLDKYMTSLMMLDSEGSSAYNKVYKQYEQIVDRCTVHATLDITYDQIITLEDGYDSFEYQGTVTIYFPLIGLEDDEEFGIIKGGGTLLLKGSGQSKDCTWTKAGNIDVTASGNLEAGNDPGSLTPELNLTLTEAWSYTQTTICDKTTWSQDISLSPEPATFKVPYVDGHTIEKTSTFQNTVTHIKYVFHFPDKD